MREYRLDLGRHILNLEEEEERRRRKQEEGKRRSVTGIEVDDQNYKREERVVYVSGFDRKLAFVDLENYLKKYGEIVQVERKIDSVRNKYDILFLERKKQGIRIC
jgi:RNA recognition motif-containing protein